MPLSSRIEAAIAQAIAQGQRAHPGSAVPPRLASALNYAVTPGGARIRPTILLSVAMACGDDRPVISDTAAAALELIHCASLVHDDMPCFDDADIRRGKPSVHRAYSEPLALLTGDSLIILAFDILARAGASKGGLYHHFPDKRSLALASMDFFLHSDAPPGSGLGSSSTLVVALIGLFHRWLHLPHG